VITEEALTKMLAAHEAEMATLGQQMQYHQQHAAVCERKMIHKAGQISSLKEMLAPVAPEESMATVTEPAEAARKRKR
jgi:hypothetical protein